MWDLVENPEDRFSHNEAHLIVSFSGHFMYTTKAATLQSQIPVTATLLSPKFETGTHQCLQFSYLFGGNSNISLRLFGNSNAGTNTEQLLWKVNAITTFNLMKWLEAEVSLPSKISRLKFVAKSDSGTHGVGIDDVLVTSAPCSGWFMEPLR